MIEAHIDPGQEAKGYTPTFDVYPEHLLGNPDLPIAKHRSEIEDSLTLNTVTIIESTTGSGKSTQVVQYIRELQMHGLPVAESILTQPRILPARALAERIAYEMVQAGIAEPKVGYYTQPESSDVPQDLQDIAVLTEGKAAMQLLHRDTYHPSKLRYLAIDEVHEFGKFTELLLAIAHNKTNPASADYDPNLRVVVMSATLDAERMKRYFNHASTGLVQVHVPTYPVERSDSADPLAKVALRLSTGNATVLAFHAGKGEINSTQEAITKIQATNTDTDDQVAVVPLHAQQNAIQQKLAFEQHPNGLIVLTTNVAETSVTVPDAVAAVDTGEVRVASVSYKHVPTGHATLNLQDASQASIDQRAGRVGRTQPGEYILVTQAGAGLPLPYKLRHKYPIPSIQRESLDDLLLFVKATGHQLDDFTFFHDTPGLAIEAAQRKLFVLSALDADGVITERGKRMDALPLNPEFACMVVYAEEQGYSDQVKQNVIDIAAIMQRGGIVSRSPKERRWMDLLARDAQDEITEKDSDYFAQLEAYVSLVSNHPADHWQDYDVNVHAVELITKRRESLAKAAGMHNLQPVGNVEPKNRAAVLACIHAGQLPQLWHRNGDKWHLLLGTEDFDLHQSSVVDNIGRLATGSLFST